LLRQKELQPQYLAPEWFRQLKPVKTKELITARTCPGFVSMFRACIVMPLWCDIRLTRIRRGPGDQPIPDPNGEWILPTLTPDGFEIDFHGSAQVSGMPGTFGMVKLPKLLCPWYLEMDPGWSIMVMPATLHSSRLPWEPIPGVINVDHWHQLHMPCRFTREPEAETAILAGTPLAYLLPFKRSEDPGELTLNFVEGDALNKVHGDRESMDYQAHLVGNYGRAPD
jgi:hypothetical protein